MQIILQEDIEKLGHRGDVVTVKPGYARNFLLPQKLAVEATAGNLKAIERIRTSLAKKTATEQEAAEKQAALLNGVLLKFTRKTVGEFPVTIKVFRDVTAQIKVSVEKET